MQTVSLSQHHQRRSTGGKRLYMSHLVKILVHRCLDRCLAEVRAWPVREPVSEVYGAHLTCQRREFIPTRRALSDTQIHAHKNRGSYGHIFLISLMGTLRAICLSSTLSICLYIMTMAGATCDGNGGSLSRPLPHNPSDVRKA